MAGTTQHELLIINDFYTCTCDEFLFDRIFEISGTTVIAYIYSLAASVENRKSDCKWQIDRKLKCGI